MGSLRDELLKAKFITKKEAKKAKREAREKQKQHGPESTEMQQYRKSRNYKEDLLAKADLDRQMEKKRQEEHEEPEKTHRLNHIIQSGRIVEGRNGKYRFHYVTRTGHIPFIEVTPQLSLLLEHGDAAIVEYPDETKVEIISRDAARKINLLDSRRIRFFINGNKTMDGN
ncbi:DUF2058 family protein [bacterium]|nr:DUF2058 family protein [candidate division CSSED10-310 bacterium]